MQYVILTTEEAEGVGIKVMPTMRTSLDGTKVILHSEMVTMLDKGKFKRYEHDSQELNEILNSAEWSEPIDETTYVQ